jgi:hypothetical protein
MSVICSDMIRFCALATRTGTWKGMDFLTGFAANTWDGDPPGNSIKIKKNIGKNLSLNIQNLTKRGQQKGASLRLTFD